MRILFIVHRFPPNFLGGADIYTYQLAKGFVQKGHTVQVFCNRSLVLDSSPSGRIEIKDDFIDGISVRRLSWNWGEMPDPYGYLYVSNPLVGQELARLISQFAPEIIYITACDYLSNSILEESTRTNIPIFLELTGKWHICPTATLLRRDGELCHGRQNGAICAWCLFGNTNTLKILGRFPPSFQGRLITFLEKYPAISRKIGTINFIRAVDRRNGLFKETLEKVNVIFSPSECHRTVYSECGMISREQIRFKKHPRDYDPSVTLPHGEKTRNSVIRISYTGIIAPHKGIHILIEAYKKLQGQPRAQLNIYGDLATNSGYADRLIASASGRADIVFKGTYRPEQLPDVMKNTDIVVVPSICVENAPNTIDEAFIYHIPVIGSDTPGVAEHIRPEVNGLIFKRGNADNLAAVLQRILHQPELIEKLSNGIPRIKTIEEGIAELEQLFMAAVTDPQER